MLHFRRRTDLTCRSLVASSYLQDFGLSIRLRFGCPPSFPSLLNSKTELFDAILGGDFELFSNFRTV